ncbi:hypothetical protein PT047_01755 [Erysipelothrix rhusiopathiae]|nr:hypothetical protein [Erysipelothrix rhusiopathiae]MDE8091817.1 hypothetical protein [Erysipelothrix rhusiopathiae]MDE8097835.1 hypothetical protein [Erysipelothrix rhusiopathiae]MDE8106430.1 hypothetical protein [Erysipelothrix rhusiopathiae]MDE8108186.1 hypothetical protein [Erysipelothrix rhusiopathiae]
MNIYLRKILKHDITHQISLTKEVLNSFFSVNTDKASTQMKGKKSKKTRLVTFLLSTDPRFGGDIKQIINDEGGMDIDDILLFTKKKDFYEIEVISSKDLRYDTLISMMSSERHLIINTDENNESSDISVKMNINYKTNVENLYPRNRILFGAPGTGKSYTLNNEKKELLERGKEDDYERVTFHPDYSYANFVGTYKPVMVEDTSQSNSETNDEYVISVLTDIKKSAEEKYDLLHEKFKDDELMRLPLLLGLYTDDEFIPSNESCISEAGCFEEERILGNSIRPYINLAKTTSSKKDISYEYVPGPFMRILVKALKNAMTDEQRPFLLIIEEINRANVSAVFGEVFQLLDRDNDGVSEYKIATTNDMRRYLSEQLNVSESDVETIKIPNNLFIWSTMNSADQGVFPMDTAFKRRWDFTYLGIDDSDEKIRGKYVLLADDCSQKVEWNKLRKAINNFLAKEKINEDKLLGPYFISKSIIEPNGDEIDRIKFINTFKNKVIMYLFEDAARQKRSKLFEGCLLNNNRYSDICKEFEEKGVKIFNKDIIIECEIDVFKNNSSN